MQVLWRRVFAFLNIFLLLNYLLSNVDEFKSIAPSMVIEPVFLVRKFGSQLHQHLVLFFALLLNLHLQNLFFGCRIDCFFFFVDIFESIDF